MLSDDFIIAMGRAIEECGSQKNLSLKSGIHQSRISDYSNGNYDFDNLTIGSLKRLFPKLKILYFEDDIKTDTVNYPVEEQLQDYLKTLSPKDKVKCLMLVSANFPERILKETK